MDSRPSTSALIEDVLELTQRWGQLSVGWWVTAATRPVDLESVLVGRGAVHEDTVDVLGLDLTGTPPDLGPPTGASAERVGTREQHRDVDQVYVSLGQPPATQDSIEAAMTRETDGAEF